MATARSSGLLLALLALLALISIASSQLSFANVRGLPSSSIFFSCWEQFMNSPPAFRNFRTAQGKPHYGSLLTHFQDNYVRIGVPQAFGTPEARSAQYTISATMNISYTRTTPHAQLL